MFAILLFAISSEKIGDVIRELILRKQDGQHTDLPQSTNEIWPRAVIAILGAYQKIMFPSLKHSYTIK